MKISIKLFLFMVVLSPLVLSCSSDDNGDDGGDSRALELVGSWVLVQMNVSAAIDANFDDITSSNLLDEADCLEETIVLASTFEWTSTAVFPNVISPITGDLYTISCLPAQNRDGDWGVTDNNLFLIGTVNRTFSISGNQLIESIGQDLPGIRTLVYERQQ